MAQTTLHGQRDELRYSHPAFPSLTGTTNENQDSYLEHLSHAMGCTACNHVHDHCDDLANELRRKNKKLRKRLKASLKLSPGSKLQRPAARETSNVWMPNDS